MDARAWPHFDDVVRGPDGVFVVLDDEDGVADVTEPLDRRDHLDVVFRMQSDARLVEHVEHPHQTRPDLGREADPLRLAARERRGAAVETEVVETDPEQQLEAGADFFDHLAAGIRATSGQLQGAKKSVELVEVQLAEVVDRFFRDGEELAGRAQARAVAVRAGALDHHLVEPLFHPRVHLPLLAVAAIVPLDAPRDPVEPDLPSVMVVAVDLGVGRRAHRDRPRIDAVEDGVARSFRQVLPRTVERELLRQREAVHHQAVPRVGVVLEGLAHEAATQDASVRIRHEQLRVGQLVDAEPAARAARALGIVEDEIVRTDVAINEVMRRTAQAAVEPRRLRLTGTLHDLHLHQTVADQQRARDPGLDRLLVTAADDEPVDHGGHVRDR